MSVERLDELYATLEVSRSADHSTIKNSYRRLVLKYRDAAQTSDSQLAQEKIRAINFAYDTLGNMPKRNVFESQAAAIKSVRNKKNLDANPFVDRVDAALPKTQFLICPMGHPDKFLRCVDRSLVFQSRNDAKNVSFEDFFADAKFAFKWLPDPINPEMLPRFRCPCMLQKSSEALQGVITPMRPDSVGWASFGLAAGVASSDIMITNVVNNACSNVLLAPSPDFQNAYRILAESSTGHYLAFDPPTLAQMTTSLDMFTVIDFVAMPVEYSYQYQRVEEVLLPAVVELGGRKNYIPLLTVCRDARVVAYFKRNVMWDFQDFEAYFLAHEETWDYHVVIQSVRLREAPKDETAATADDSKRKAISLPEETPEAKLAKSSGFNRDPTRVVLLTNLVGAGEIDNDLEEETAEEAGKYGALKECKIIEVMGVADDEAVRVFLHFETVEAATKAFTDMNGRFFGGRKVKSYFFDETFFSLGKLQKNANASSDANARSAIAQSQPGDLRSIGRKR